MIRPSGLDGTVTSPLACVAPTHWKHLDLCFPVGTQHDLLVTYNRCRSDIADSPFAMGGTFSASRRPKLLAKSAFARCGQRAITARVQRRAVATDSRERRACVCSEQRRIQESGSATPDGILSLHAIDDVPGIFRDAQRQHGTVTVSI